MCSALSLRGRAPPARRLGLAACSRSSVQESSRASPTTMPAGITTYSIAGAQFGYDLLWVLLVSQLALMVTQEAGARLGLATGHGLSGLIRERYGVRWATFAVLTMLAANLGDTVAEFAGIGAALALFGVPVALSAARRRRRDGRAARAGELSADPDPVRLRGPRDLARLPA